MDLKFTGTTIVIIFLFFSAVGSGELGTAEPQFHSVTSDLVTGSTFSFYENFSEFQLKRGGSLHASSIYLYRNVTVLNVSDNSSELEISCSAFQGGIVAHFQINCLTNVSYMPCIYYVNLSGNVSSIFGNLNYTFSNCSYLWQGGEYNVEKIFGKIQYGNSSAAELILYVDKYNGISLAGMFSATSVYKDCTVTVSNNFSLYETNVNMHKVASVYSVTFEEFGLPDDYLWNLTIGNTSFSTNGTNFTIILQNGSYSYSVSAIGYYAHPVSGSFKVDGTPVNVKLKFIQIYHLIFSQNGLASGLWYVNISSKNLSAIFSSNISVTLPPGTYTYTISTTNKSFEPFEKSGTIDLTEPYTTVNVTFKKVLFEVYFVETGLPAGQNWSVTFDGITESSSSNYLEFYVTNGTYSYYVVALHGYNPVPISGIIKVNGVSATGTISFEPVNVKTSDIFNLTTISIISGLIGAAILIGLAFFLTGRRK